MSLVLKAILYAGVFYALIIALMFFRQESLLFAPDKRNYSQKDVNVEGYVDITVRTQDGLTLHGWYAAARPGKQTILLFHGNASTWQWRANDFLQLVNAGYGVLLAGYRGYGGNPGHPSEQGFYQDAEAYLNYLIAQGVSYGQIALYGESLGTGVAVEMAARHSEITALILEAPYATIAEIAAFHYPYVPAPKLMLRNKFESLYKIGALAMPKLFFVAEEDGVIPARFGLKLYENAPSPKKLKIFKRAGHTDMRSMGALADTAMFLKALN